LILVLLLPLRQYLRGIYNLGRWSSCLILGGGEERVRACSDQLIPGWLVHTDFRAVGVCQQSCNAIGTGFSSSLILDT
jgi:hypothetical protein